MQNSRNKLVSISDLSSIIDIIHLPAAIIRISDEAELAEVVHKNEMFASLFKLWLKNPMPLPNSIVIAFNDFLNTKKITSEPIFAFVEELQQLCRVDVSSISDKHFLAIFSHNAGGCFLNRNDLSVPEGCSCELTKFSEGRIVVDFKGNVLAFNNIAQKHAEEFFEVSFALGQSIFSSFQKVGVEDFQLGVKSSQKGDCFEFTTMRMVKGEEKGFRFCFSPLCDSAGNPYAVHILFEDVTSCVLNEQNINLREGLIKGEQRLNRAQEIAKIGSWEEHNDSNKCYWSDETYRIFGLKKGSVKPTLKSIIKYVDQEKREALESFLTNPEVPQNEEKLKFPFRYKRSTDEEKYLLLIAEPNISAEGNLLFWQGVVQDISWQKNYERFLKEGRENLMALVTNMPALVFATDKSGNLVFWNRTCEEVTGYKSKDIVSNKEAFKLLYPDAELRRKIRSQLKDMGMALSTWEHQITTKKGEKRDIVWSAFSEFVRVEGWNAVAIGYDITFQKHNERMQAAYRRKLEALAETAIDFVGMPLDDSLYHYLGTQFEKHIPGHVFIIQSLNPDDNFLTIEGVYGLKAKEWEQVISFMGWNPVGRRFALTDGMRTIFSRTKPVRIDLGLYEFTEGMVSSVAARSVEKYLSIKKLFTIGLLKDESLLGAVTIITRNEMPEFDMSIVEGLVNQAAVAIDRRNLEFQLVQAKEKAEEADRLKSAFLANMSHEIRTPMNAILGFSQLLNLSNLSKEKRKQYVDIINSKGNMLVKLINDIIDASKVEAKQLTLVYAPCKLNQLLKNMHRFWNNERLFQKREAIELRLSIPKNTNRLELITDEGRLEQIFTNLISNALKFTEKGHIDFGYDFDGESIVFFVKDTGVGIESNQQKVIFDRFRQVEVSPTRTQGGTGLGLAISKGIVDLMGGKIWVESSLGEGAQFYFSLPYKVPKKILTNETLIELDEEEAVEEFLPDWKNKILLVAEDEEVNYILLEELLEQTGVNIIWAKDGSQAVELVKTIKNIDAILMDIKMPVMNGYAATMEIRHINSQIPIVAQTAYAFTEDRQKAEAAGCDEYITKPINRDELFGILDKFIG
ncbi:MAG TPA: ATP-binding protein [Tenuifilaceae bacterium]|nr:ATP-binding protein [Tenuifilaceae bacterium]HRX68810.1 ATP-binding protein [Tenuifilaceae bacterium]